MSSRGTSSHHAGRAEDDSSDCYPTTPSVSSAGGVGGGVGGGGRKRHTHRPGQRPMRSLPHLMSLIFHPVFLGLFGLLVVALGIPFWLVLIHPEVGDFQHHPPPPPSSSSLSLSLSDGGPSAHAAVSIEWNMQQL